MAVDSPPSPGPIAHHPRRRRQFWIVVVLLAGLASLILRYSSSLVIVDERLPAQVDAILLYDGDQRHAIAADWLASGRCNAILLPRRLPDRNQTLGILEPFDVYSRQTLIQLGVPENAIETLDNHDQFGEWKYVRLLRTWLEQHPEATAVVFCDRFHSRETRYAIRHVLTANQRHRVQVYALPSRSYDEQRWWRSRRGAVDYFNALIGLMYASCVGEDPDQPLTWNVDDFEWRLGHP